MTRENGVTEVLHGVEVADPHRWLEGSAAPEVEGDDPELDARVSGWTDLRNAETRRALDGRPGRRELEARLRELLTVEELGMPQVGGDRVFHERRAGDQAQPVLFVRDGAGGEPRVLLDVNSQDEEGLLTLSWFSPSPDGRLVAYGLFRAGDERDVLHLLDATTGEPLPDEIPGRVQDASWLPDSRGFFYRNLEDPDDPYSGQVCYHALGTDPAGDPVLIAQEREGPLATTWGPFGYCSRDGRWLLLGYFTGTDANDLWVVDLADWFETGEVRRREIVTGERAMSAGPVVDGTLFLKTTLGAPNGRVVAVDLADPARERWREVVPEGKGALADLAAGKGILVATWLEDARSRVARFSLDGEPRGDVDLPGPGTAQVAAFEDRTDAFLAFESFDTPKTVYHLDLETGRLAEWARPRVDADPDSLEVRQAFFDSQDGTRVPIFVVHRRGLRRDGGNPAVLSGYGGFGVSRTPLFSGPLQAWLERGGVYAVANLRGGGEYGEEWHRAGMRERKENVFADFEAAAEWLVESGYTSPDRLGISGGSNGGLLVGAALTRRPELFRAVYCAVPLLDMLRYHHFLMARYWVPEYGSSEDPEMFPVLHGYSPYHRVRDGERYPSVLLTAGEHDSRVHPLHARKMAARLAEATEDPAGRPVLLWIDRTAGHGRGKPLEHRVREAADVWGFLMWQLGMDSD